MIRLSRHVRFDRLERLAADEATPRQRRRILRHLASCTGCRARYQWVRTLPGRLEAATRPPPPSEAEERILAMRAAGDRVILPTRRNAVVGRRWGGRRLVATMVAVAIAVGLSSWFAARGALEATSPAHGTLSVRPPAPRAGDRIVVEYHAAPELQGESSLVLRGILAPSPRIDRSSPAPRSLGTLTPTSQNGDTYRGHFVLPAGHVYARLVVENEDGSVIDDGRDASWDVHASDGSGPSRDALWAHALHAGRWADAYAAIRRATELHPDDPRFRALRLTLELSFFTRAERDSALARHRAGFAGLVAGLEGQATVGPETLAGLIEYAHAVGDVSAAEGLARRLVERYPLHPEAIWYRVPAALASPDSAAVRRYLERLESLWQANGPHVALLAPGLWAARLVGEPDYILTWAKRAMKHGGPETNRHRVSEVLAEVPSLRDSALAYLRVELDRLERGQAPRPLGRTKAEHRRASRLAMRPLLVALSRALRAEDERAAALDSLRLAASIGWSDDVYARLAEAELAAGDTTAAATSLARAAARPFEQPVGGLPLSRGPELMPAEEWELLRRAARDDLYRDVLARSIEHEPEPEPVYAYDAAGARHDLDQLRHGSVTLVVFWDPRNGDAERHLSEFRRVAYLVRACGGEVVVVTRTPPGDRLRRILDEKDVPGPLYYDLDDRVTSALGSTSAPEYHVLDFAGRLRFADSPLEDVLVQVDALLDEPRLTATGGMDTPNR